MGYMSVYDSGISILFMAGSYVLLDLLFEFLGEIPFGLSENLLLYIIFKLGVGFIIAQLFLYRTRKPYNKYVKQGRL